MEARLATRDVEVSVYTRAGRILSRITRILCLYQSVIEESTARITMDSSEKNIIIIYLDFSTPNMKNFYTPKSSTVWSCAE